MSNYEMSDSRLVSQYVNGNEEAFARLLERHQQRVYTTIFMIVKNKPATEDLMQETFIRVVNTLKSGKYNESGKFLPWVLRIAHNLAVDRYRKQKRFPEIVLSPMSLLRCARICIASYADLYRSFLKSSVRSWSCGTIWV